MLGNKTTGENCNGESQVIYKVPPRLQEKLALRGIK